MYPIFVHPHYFYPHNFCAFVSGYYVNILNKWIARILVQRKLVKIMRALLKGEKFIRRRFMLMRREAEQFENE